MKYCSNCGKPMDDNAAFCGCCGASFTPREYDRALQEECLHTLYHRLRTERRCWRIFGVVFLVLTIILVLCSFVIFVCAGVTGSEFAVLSTLLGVYYLIYTLIGTLPLCIINFVAASKLDRYIDTYYTDIGATLERCGSPGAIVLGALCNSVSLIFIIINFVYIKRNQAVFNEILRNQRAQYNMWQNEVKAGN